MDDHQITRKTCSRCGASKDVSGFGRRKANRDGLRGVCKECETVDYKTYYEANAEKMRKKSSAYRSKNPEKVYEANKKWKAANPDRARENLKRWHLNNPDKSRAIKARQYAKSPEKYKALASAYYSAHKSAAAAAQKAWAENNRERLREIRRKWESRNPEKARAASAAWASKNRARLLAYNRTRAASLLNATPEWLTKDDREAIVSIYETRARTTTETGILYHVDHIVPLRGETVCGLHVPWNLQVIPATENVRKHNKLVAA